MVDRSESRRDYLTIQAVNPVDGKTCEVLISFDRMQTVGRRSMGHAKEYRRDGTEDRPYPNQVYLVFVNEEGVVYNWRWEQADPDKPSLPVDYQARFKKQVL